MPQKNTQNENKAVEGRMQSQLAAIFLSTPPEKMIRIRRRSDEWVVYEQDNDAGYTVLADQTQYTPDFVVRAIYIDEAGARKVKLDLVKTTGMEITLPARSRETMRVTKVYLDQDNDARNIILFV